MTTILKRLRKNTFSSKKEVSQGFSDLFAPLKPFFEKDRLGHLKLGSHGTVYNEETREVEAFMRPLWGYAPYLTQGDSSFLNTFLAGIIAGTDPKHPDYWGEVQDFDQLIVEMASLSTTLLLNKEKVWDLLSKEQQQNLHAWLIQVNDHTIPRNNWHFFRILVNVAMKKMQMSYSEEILQADLDLMDSFYVGKGWYFDGQETQFDYYISFAIHYYSLVYCRFMEEEDSERTTVMKQRAIEFAQTFKYWFDASGEALPFGRSLTYRFAQCSFFSALVFADVEALPWSEIKGLFSRNMQNWMQQEILTTDDLLSVGYHYQNLVFAEGYNAPGSPYWSFKSFLLLAVPEDHPYWQAEATPLNIEKRQLSLPESKNYYLFNEDLTHLQAFPAGQFVNQQNHASGKYSKFVYSTRFGFSVPKSNYLYYEGAFDSCLALSEDDHYFRTKGLDTAYEFLEDRIIHQWQPWQDVEIKSTIIPLNAGWHLRVHEIQNQRELFVYDGGFSVPKEKNNEQVENLIACYESSIGTSHAIGIKGYQEAEIVRTEPNTNLFYPLTVLPYVKAKLSVGNHQLVSLVGGQLPHEKVEIPEVCVKENSIVVEQGQTEMEIRYTQNN
ncbi:hypothetical protein M2139_000949 [Enterococcus sp. PF1-24]|uniref:DUF2264 domain-containing protein n=1 Tax=unclassified Enterococcus TaxID=2608891 RepID=UPI002475DD87|nr:MULTISPECIES: DUF2264 domain-containing protein [unclassified Enterococcus]MDH6363964.1 hypothetical protein [Enterococcus sp. PFB1-1]MDH6401065.1 hypothetical protein [Enterococcus sp. PF1-24]